MKNSLSKCRNIQDIARVKINEREDKVIETIQTEVQG